MIRKIVLLAAVFFLFVYACWNFYTKTSLDPFSEVAVSPRAPKAAQAPAEGAYRTAWSRDIIEKNLFSPARTYAPPKPAVAAAAPPPEKRPEFALKGIVLDASGDYVAYISIDKAKSIAVRKGDKIEKTEIIDVSARQAVLKWNGEKIDLSMERIKTIDNSKEGK